MQPQPAKPVAVRHLGVSSVAGGPGPHGAEIGHLAGGIESLPETRSHPRHGLSRTARQIARRHRNTLPLAGRECLPALSASCVPRIQNRPEGGFSPGPNARGRTARGQISRRLQRRPARARIGFARTQDCNRGPAVRHSAGMIRWDLPCKSPHMDDPEEVDTCPATRSTASGRSVRSKDTPSILSL